MTQPLASADERFAAIVATLRDRPGVAVPAGAVGSAKRFGSTALKVDNRIFAMLVGGELVVKLPRSRVDGLVAAGVGDRFDPGRGRVMKEWLAVSADAEDDWLALAAEALAFVAPAR